MGTMTPLFDIRRALAEEIDRRQRQLCDMRDERDQDYKRYEATRMRYDALLKDFESLCEAANKIEGVVE